MNKMAYRGIIILLLLFLVAGVASAYPAVQKNALKPLDRLASLQQTKASVYSSSMVDMLREFRAENAASGGNVSISISISNYGPSQSCTSCGTGWARSWPGYWFEYNYPNTYYPGPPEPAERGYGSLLVAAPQLGGLGEGSNETTTYYLWIKSGFFATDVEPGYNMQWRYGGILPVYYENNILAGSYCLKVTVTSNHPTDPAVWCGSAIIAANQTTRVYPQAAGCPFSDCACGY